MDKFTELLSKLAAQLGTTVDHLWTVLLNQARVEMYTALTMIVAGLLALIIASLLLPSTIRLVKKSEWLYEGAGRIFIQMGAIIFGILFIVVNTPIFLTTYFNPEYWALQQVMRLF